MPIWTKMNCKYSNWYVTNVMKLLLVINTPTNDIINLDRCSVDNNMFILSQGDIYTSYINQCQDCDNILSGKIYHSMYGSYKCHLNYICISIGIQVPSSGLFGFRVVLCTIFSAKYFGCNCYIIQKITIYNVYNDE